MATTQTRDKTGNTVQFSISTRCMCAPHMHLLLAKPTNDSETIGNCEAITYSSYNNTFSLILYSSHNNHDDDNEIIGHNYTLLAVVLVVLLLLLLLLLFLLLLLWATWTKLCCKCYYSSYTYLAFENLCCSEMLHHNYDLVSAVNPFFSSVIYIFSANTNTEHSYLFNSYTGN